jgi:hypothetical protein
MGVRNSMWDLIGIVGLLVGDPNYQQFTPQQYQDTLDRSREDVRYEDLALAPAIVNTTSTTNQPQFIYADYYSQYEFWESDAIIQGYLNGAPWKVLTPTAAEWDKGHWQFEGSQFGDVWNLTSGITVPGQLPPLFITGKIYDPYCAAADILEMWASQLIRNYDFTSDGQSFRRSQAYDMTMKRAASLRRQQKPLRLQATRDDLNTGQGHTKSTLLGSNIE